MEYRVAYCRRHCIPSITSVYDCYIVIQNNEPNHSHYFLYFRGENIEEEEEAADFVKYRDELLSQKYQHTHKFTHQSHFHTYRLRTFHSD